MISGNFSGTRVCSTKMLNKIKSCLVTSLFQLFSFCFCNRPVPFPELADSSSTFLLLWSTSQMLWVWFHFGGQLVLKGCLTWFNIHTFISYGAVMFKSYCTHSRINCGIAKSLAQARALLLYTSSHILGMFWVILCVILGPIRPRRLNIPRNICSICCQKWSENLRNHAYSYSNGLMAFVLLAYYWTILVQHRGPGGR